MNTRSTWRVTVAAIISRGGRFLFVEEKDSRTGERVLNQPAGHVEPGEALRDAVVREVREETGLAFTPEALVGLYQLRARDGRDFLRVCFSGSVAPGDAVPEDPDILACHWLIPEELGLWRLRSPLVGQCLRDHQTGMRLPLEAAAYFQDERG